MSPYHFSRAFKRASGVPPMRYLFARRINAARRELRDTNRPVGDIAMACGFSSQSHLAHALKRAIGLTPSQYRALARARESDAAGGSGLGHHQDFAAIAVLGVEVGALTAPILHCRLCKCQSLRNP